MANFAGAQNENTNTEVYTKTGSSPCISFAPGIKHQSIAFTVSTDAYRLKTADKYQQHGFGADIRTDFSILEAGLKTFSDVKDAAVYDITYVLNSGTNHQDNAATYTYGIGLTLKAPTRDGYIFVGWYDNENLSGDAVTAISDTDTGDKTFYARWNAMIYAITYHLNSGTNHPDNAATYTYGIGLTLKAPIRYGYSFAGWYNNENLSGDAVTAISDTDTGDKTFYARWDAITNAITYHLNGGTNHPDNAATYTYGIGLTLKAPIRYGYSFAGWYDNENLSGDAVTAISDTDTGDKTFYARWNAMTYAITPIDDQTMTPLTAGYTSGSQETKTITVTRNGNGDLTNLAVSLSDNNYFNITQPQQTLNDSTPSTTFTIKAKDGLAVGTYTATVTVTATNMVPIIFTITQVVSRPSGGGSSGSSSTGTLVTPLGRTFSQNGITLSFPVGTIESDMWVQVKEAALSAGMTLPDGSKLISRIIDIIKDKSGDFLKPVTITISFDISGLNPDEYDFAVYYYDEYTGKWIALDNIRFNLETGTISGDTTHFTKFAVIAAPKAIKEEKPSQPSTPQPIINIPSDISSNWARDSIMKLMEAGIVSGYPDGTFKPDKTITRAEFTVMLIKALQLSGETGGIFEDCREHWAQDSIAIAAAHGIISGYNKNTFGPNDLITREQAAVIIACTAQLEARTNELHFTDSITISPWAIPGVAAAFKSGFISGYPDGSFKPQGNTTRAEAAVIIGKLL